MKKEAKLVTERYARRPMGDRYSMLRPEVLLEAHERQKAMLHLFKHNCGYNDLSTLRLTEVGCGNAGNLLELLRFGFTPPNLTGIELLPERVTAAQYILPTALTIHEGDATTTNIVTNSQDVVFQSIVFSSLLDDSFQQILADRMWEWVKPGGGILWYDFIYNNPLNPDVRGVSVKRVRELFPEGHMIVKRVTLAPPISRYICQFHPKLCNLFNAIPWLRTHVLIWIRKPKEG